MRYVELPYSLNSSGFADPQQFQMAFPTADYVFALRKHVPSQLWMLDLYDGDGNALVLGLEMTAGADLLEPHRYAGFPFGLVAYTDGDPMIPPTFANLGLTGRIVLVFPS